MKLYNTYSCQHKDWSDYIHINWDNKTFNRTKLISEGGNIILENNLLYLKWSRWDPEILQYNNITKEFTNDIFNMIPIISKIKIPKIIHQIWIGHKLRPDYLMNTFIKQHNAILLDDPSKYQNDDKWYYILWDEKKIDQFIKLVNNHQYIKTISYAGKCDILRYEILYNYGGIFFDADCLCLKMVPNNFLEYNFFSGYENEKRRPGLIANGIIGCTKSSIILNECIKSITLLKKLEPACNFLGPHLLTKIINNHKNLNILINPSYIFLPVWLNPKPDYTNYPNVLNDKRYNNQIICNHLWISTHNNFDKKIYNNYFYNNYPGISILMPVYNEDISIFKECIDSILNQSFKFVIELVIINDGSNKEIFNYLNTLNNLESQYLLIKIIHLSLNNGITNALRTGILECKYELIARMDSDDIMYPDRLEKQYNYFLNNEIDMLGTGIEMFYDNGKKSKKIIHPKIIDRNYVKTKKSLWFINHPTVMFKKKIVIDSDNYLDSDVPEDFDLWIRILKKGYIIHNLSDICLKYRRNSNNLSKPLKKEVISKMNYLIETI